MARGYRQEDTPFSRDKKTVRFAKVTCIHATEKAILCQMASGREVWWPQSHVDDESEVWREGDTGTLVVSEWIAKEKGLI